MQIFSNTCSHCSALNNWQKNKPARTSLVVQWLGLSSSTARGVGSVPGWGTKIPLPSGMAKK